MGVNEGGFGLVFGAGSGIGRETAYVFAERGATGIVCADLNEDEAKTTAETCKKLATHANFRALAMRVDVTDRDAVDKVVEITRAEFGTIDFNVNSAGIGAGMEAAVADMSTEEFDRVMNVNTRGLFFCTSAVIRVMRDQEEKFIEGRNGRRGIGRGAIVNLASLNGVIPVPRLGQYGTSKYAAVGMTATAASEMADKGVRINCMLPTWVETNMMAAVIKNNPDLDKAIKNGLVPAKRMAKPEEVAEAIHFLCSPSASYIQGIGLAVDSGFSLTRGLA